MKYIFTDLDNTIIFRKGLKENLDINVEIYNNQEFSFITKKESELLKQIQNRGDIEIIPITTRSLYQYERINLPYHFRFYMCCNGGLLFKNGIEYKDWFSELKNSDRLLTILNCLKKELNSMEGVEDIRLVHDLFLFFKISDFDKVSYIKRVIDNSEFSVYSKKHKCYIMPTILTKGNSIIRFKERFLKEDDEIYTLGDSALDLSMFKVGNYNYMLQNQLNTDSNVKKIDLNDFPEKVLEEILGG